MIRGQYQRFEPSALSPTGWSVVVAVRVMRAAQNRAGRAGPERVKNCAK